MRFPGLHARDLDGHSVSLPGDLGSGPTLLLVHFTPQVADEVETWLPLVADLTDAVSDFWCYDLLVLPEFPDAVKSSLAADLYVAGADGGADDAVPRMLTGHTDLAAFQRSLVLDRPDRMYALLLRDGRVQWRAFGPLTTPLERRLRGAVERAYQDGDSDELVVS